MLAVYSDAMRACSGLRLSDAALWRDYRLAHLCNVFLPVFQQDAKPDDDGWWAQLRRWEAAFDALDCAEFL